MWGRLERFGNQGVALKAQRAQGDKAQLEKTNNMQAFGDCGVASN